MRATNKRGKNPAQVCHLSNCAARRGPQSSAVLDIRLISMWAIPAKVQPHDSGWSPRNIHFWFCHMVMPFALPCPGSTIHAAYTQTDCIWLFAPFNFNFLWSNLDVSITSSIFSPFLYFIDELSWEIEGHRTFIWFGFQSWGKAVAEPYCILSFAKFSLCPSPFAPS